MRKPATLFLDLCSLYFIVKDLERLAFDWFDQTWKTQRKTTIPLGAVVVVERSEFAAPASFSTTKLHAFQSYDSSHTHLSVNANNQSH